MDEILGTNYLKLGGEEKMFKAENPTLLTGGYLNYMDIKSDSGFDINEALNPSEDLEEICKELGREIGFSSISELSVEKHDEMIAFLSQLTHCIAITLMTCNDTEGLEKYTGDSFRDLTRI
ncbi:MAG: prephenate dehydrogenase/arogenate dehydrogenase family protein, partial [Clostridia bacterium]|nr:prephenate dehydrogenase/arogenate dehydrogenase family protein [Clostridia bacterium]